MYIYILDLIHGRIPFSYKTSPLLANRSHIYLNF